MITKTCHFPSSMIRASNKRDCQYLSQHKMAWGMPVPTDTIIIDLFQWLFLIISLRIWVHIEEWCCSAETDDFIDIDSAYFLSYFFFSLLIERALCCREIMGLKHTVLCSTSGLTSIPCWLAHVQCINNVTKCWERMQTFLVADFVILFIAVIPKFGFGNSLLAQRWKSVALNDWRKSEKASAEGGSKLVNECELDCSSRELRVLDHQGRCC